MQYTLNMSIIAVKMYCEAKFLKEIKEYFGISDPNRLVRKGLIFLNKKHSLSLLKDNKSSIGFCLNSNDKIKILNICQSELEAPEILTVNYKSFLDEEFFTKVVAEIHLERMEIMSKFNTLNDKLLKIERHIKSKINNND